MLKITLMGFASGCIGTLLGGIIGIFINNNSKRVYTSILEFTAGLMLSIACFELLPKSMELSNIITVLFGFSSGVCLMIFIDDILLKKTKSISKSGYILGLMIFISISIHNFPEGLAIGAGYDISPEMGLSLLFAIALHDIPEGIGIVLPMKLDKKIPLYMLILYPFLSGVPTGIGALIGFLIGKISKDIVCICLSFAAGVMCYVVLGDILPESKTTYKGRLPTIMNIIGIIIGIIVSYI